MSHITTPVPLTGTAKKGAIAVAIAATLSLSATASFLVYVITLFLISRRAKLGTVNWATDRLSFLGTQFGILFVNLAVADFVQALGISLNYGHIAAGNWTSPSRGCNAQGVLIEMGDLASALSNLLITIHTFSVLMISTKIPPWATYVTIGVIWITCITCAIIPPSVSGSWYGEHSFYGWTGAWCWINSSHETYRLMIHYLWFFISMFGSMVLYTILFVRLRAHANKSSQDPATLSSDNPNMNVAIRRRRRLEKTAKSMLIYPLTFITLVLPLSTFRLAGYAGKHFGLTYASIAGVLFSLLGLTDMIVFGLTRGVLVGKKSSSRHCTSNNNASTSVQSQDSESKKGGGTRLKVEIEQQRTATTTPSQFLCYPPSKKEESL